MMPQFVICHYSEIGLKGKNRRFFEEKLIENIKKALPKNSWQKVRRISGRILIELKKEGEKKEREIKETLKNVFGIAYFAFAEKVPLDIKEIKKQAFYLLVEKFDRCRKSELKSFKIFTKRSNKNFPLTSQEVSEKVGEYVLKKLKTKNQKPKIKVNLKNPDITCFIEIVDNYAFLYTEKIPGPGGLPVGVSGKAVLLLSGGIDSAVASFYGQRRGIKIVFLHFFTHKSSIKKIEKIVKVLNKYQFESKLYLVPFLDVQKEIFQKTEPKFCCLLCRRFMFKIAEILAKKERAEALITGENIGQVASQTLRNIGVIEEITKLPVLRPLIGMDKEDIINRAKEIGSFSVSILPQEFYCQKFLPKHPETKADLEKVKREEKKLDVEKLIKEAIKRSQKIII